MVICYLNPEWLGISPSEILIASDPLLSQLVSVITRVNRLPSKAAAFRVNSVVSFPRCLCRWFWLRVQWQRDIPVELALSYQLFRLPHIFEGSGTLSYRFTIGDISGMYQRRIPSPVYQERLEHEEDVDDPGLKDLPRGAFW